LNEPFLDGLAVLVLEDEYLISVEIEDLCRDAGAADVRIVSSIEDLDQVGSLKTIDVAVVDLRLRGKSTLDFARHLRSEGMPFLFATGMSDLSELNPEFDSVAVVGKPYDSETLITAIGNAARNR